jgi:hypothetical protein
MQMQNKILRLKEIRKNWNMKYKSNAIPDYTLKLKIDKLTHAIIHLTTRQYLVRGL